MLPFCEICHERGKFKFEGLGGIKRLGNRVMYIPINDSELYIVPEILFHYFYVHKMQYVIICILVMHFIISDRILSHARRSKRERVEYEERGL